MTCRTIVLALALVAALPTPARAQATINSKLGWDQDGPDLASVNGFVYRLYCDGVATGVTLAPATCSGAATPFACLAPLVPLAGGNHTCSATAADAAGESLKSTPLAFSFIVVPTPPRNLRIIGH